MDDKHTSSKVDGKSLDLPGKLSSVMPEKLTSNNSGDALKGSGLQDPSNKMNQIAKSAINIVSVSLVEMALKHFVASKKLPLEDFASTLIFHTKELPSTKELSSAEQLSSSTRLSTINKSASNSQEDDNPASSITLADLKATFIAVLGKFSRKKTDTKTVFIPDNRADPSDGDIAKPNVAVAGNKSPHNHEAADDNVIGKFILTESIESKSIYQSKTGLGLLFPANTILGAVFTYGMEFWTYKDLLRKHFEEKRLLIEPQLELAIDFLELLNTMLLSIDDYKLNTEVLEINFSKFNPQDLINLLSQLIKANKLDKIKLLFIDENYTNYFNVKISKAEYEDINKLIVQINNRNLASKHVLFSVIGQQVTVAHQTLIPTPEVVPARVSSKDNMPDGGITNK